MIELFKKLAQNKDGICLSDHYLNDKTKLTFKCNKDNYIWESSPNNIKNKNSWCPVCAGQKRVTILEAQEISKKRGGKCLSFELKNAKSKLQWECKNKHTWVAVFDSVKNRNSWCKQCLKNQKPKIKKEKINFLSQAQELAKKYFGTCISKKYINAKQDLEFLCKFNHKFLKPLFRLKQGYWCPVCRSSFSERVCKFYFEVIFNKKFNKIRPNWLRNESNSKLELDGFNEELNIAFEHQGFQHYKLSNFCKSIEQLNIIQKNDNIKQQICKEKNIKLIIIPDIFNILKIENLKNFLKLEFEKLKIDHQNFDDKEFNYDFIYSEQNKQKQIHTLVEFQEIAKLKNGECLSKEYFSTAQHLEFKCNRHNYIWKTAAQHILHGTWCSKCQYEDKKISLEKCIELAKNKNWTCLSDLKINSYEQAIKWKCFCGHKFSCRYNKAKKYNCFKCKKSSKSGVSSHAI